MELTQKTDMKTTGTELRIHTAMTKAPKTYNGEKTASSTNVPGKSGYLSAEN
jgi:hypothetical protein